MKKIIMFKSIGIEYEEQEVKCQNIWERYIDKLNRDKTFSNRILKIIFAVHNGWTGRGFR